MSGILCGCFMSIFCFAPLFLGLGLMGPLTVSAAGIPNQRAEITAGRRQPVPQIDVRVTDSFWAPKLKIYREKTIPHSWQYVQKEIEDNEIAAGWIKIKRGEDTPWNQANLHKVLETAAYALAQESNPELDRHLDTIISAMAAAQQTNGYCNALITVRNKIPWANLDGQHDGYVAGHLIEAAVAHYQSTGKTNFLHVAQGVADHIYRYFITEKHEGVCGHAELELALVRLYRVTGEKRYLDLSRDWIERRGKPWAYTSETPRIYFMDHLPIRKVNEITGHAVRALFYANGVAEAGLESGDLELQAAARRLWQSATLRKMYVTGGVGSQEKDEGFGPDYDLPNQGGYAESCAACGMINFAESMFRIDGEASSIDVMERVLYNTALHGISLDGTNTYYRNLLHDENHARDNCWVCCPPCLSRTLLRMPEYLYAQSDAGIYLNLYAGSTAQIRLKDRQVRLVQETDYPWNGHVKLTVHPDQATSFKLFLRNPGWTTSTSLSLNGEPLKSPDFEKGYWVIDRKWQSGDRIEFEFPMPVELIEAHPKVLANRGRVAIQRGPLVYGTESLDNNGEAEITLPAKPRFQVESRPDLLNGIQVITAKISEDRSWVGIPFYALANRGLAKQTVWLRQSESRESDWKDDQLLYRPVRLNQSEK